MKQVSNAASYTNSFAIQMLFVILLSASLLLFCHLMYYILDVTVSTIFI